MSSIQVSSQRRKLNLFPRCTDHRGHPCGVPASPLGILGTRRHDLSRTEAWRIEREVRKVPLKSQMTRATTLTVVITLPVALMFSLSLLAASHRFGQWVWPISAPVFGLAMGAFIAAVLRAGLRDCFAPAYLAAGRCGACAFPLQGLNPEPDNCTVCPECGAAWKLLPHDHETPQTP
jgi:hypothetical protein